MLLLDTSRLLSFRLRLLDLPMILWCLAPLPASVTNSIALYDAASASATQFFIWGAPYLLGRLYFSDYQGLNALAVAVLSQGWFTCPSVFTNHG